MNPIQSIRQRLELTQQELADGIGVTQGNVSHYERGQTVMPAVAERLIRFARQRGHHISFDDIYAASANQSEAA